MPKLKYAKCPYCKEVINGVGHELWQKSYEIGGLMRCRKCDITFDSSWNCEEGNEYRKPVNELIYEEFETKNKQVRPCSTHPNEAGLMYLYFQNHKEEEVLMKDNESDRMFCRPLWLYGTQRSYIPDSQAFYEGIIWNFR